MFGLCIVVCVSCARHLPPPRPDVSYLLFFRVSFVLLLFAFLFLFLFVCVLVIVYVVYLDLVFSLM